MKSSIINLSRRSINELIAPKNSCYGCGINNPLSLGLTSFWDDSINGAVAEFYPKPHMNGGSAKTTCGGVIATLIDCHAINTAIASLYVRDGQEIGFNSKLNPRWCVTGQLNVKYMAVTTLEENKKIKLVSKVKSSIGRKIWVDVDVFDFEDKLTCSSQVLGVEVLASSGLVPGVKHDSKL